MSYQVPQHIDKDKIFIVNRSEIEGRLEPEFYRPSIATLEKHIRSLATGRLRDYALYMAGGATPKKTEADKYYTDSESGIPFLRVQNLQTTGELSLDDCVYINRTTHNGLLQRSQVAEGDLLVKITGVGRMAIASVAPKGFVGNTNQHMVVIKTGDAAVSRYLARYLNLDIVERIASRHSTGGTRPALDYPSLKNLPIIEGIDFSMIDEAIILKRQKEQQAEDILNSIDDYLLGELGVERPKTKSQTLQNRIFTMYFNDIRDGRMDPRSVLYMGEHAKSATYENVQLKQIAIIVKGNSITSDQVNKSGHYPVIAGGQSSPYNHDQYNFKGDVITVSASGAYSGYVWYHDNPIYASDCSIICSKDAHFLTKYIFEVLKAQQSQIYLLQQGAGQPHVYPDDLAKLWIPIVSSKKQQEIVAHITQMREQAKQLQAEGAEILQKAKLEVERMILG